MSRPRLPTLTLVLLARLVAPATAFGQEDIKPTESAPTLAKESVEDTKPAAEDLPQDRTKSLQVSAGLPPNSLDLGSEADILGVRDQREMAAMLERWSFSMKGSIRAPMRVGFGPRNDRQEGTELHALPRIVGLGSGDWNYVGLAPNASLTLGITVANPVVSGTIILSTSHFTDPSYSVIDDVGFDQAYLTFKFPKAFGNRGGIAILTGMFGERFGTSGPYQKSSGYYSTYLFGRTHQAGESTTFDFGITNRAIVDGTVFIQNAAGQTPVPITGTQLFVDLNKNGKLDAGEPSTLTGQDFYAGNGGYHFALPAGSYRIYSQTPSGTQPVSNPTGYADVTVVAGQMLNVSWHFADNGAFPSTITGTLFNDDNFDQKLDNGEVVNGNRVVFIDANHNGKLDSGEKSTTTDANGKYTFANLAAGTYDIKRVLPSSDYRITTPTSPVNLAAGQTVVFNIGSTSRKA